MTLTGMGLTALVTLGVVATAATAVDVPTVARPAEATVEAANCRAVDMAILAHVAAERQEPTTIEQVAPYLRGDVSAYRIVAGKAVGPGCVRSAVRG